MTPIDEIPTAPTTPVSGEPETTEFAGDEPFDVISSIDSLTPLSPTRTAESFASISIPSPELIEISQPNLESSFVMPQPPTPTLSLSSPYSVTLPLQSYLRASEKQITIALAGNMEFSAELFAKLGSFMPGTGRITSEHDMDVYDGTCAAQGPKLLMFNTSFSSETVSPWLEDQLQSAQPINAVLYSLIGRNRATEDDIKTMQTIQRIAVLVVVADSDADLINLARHGVTGFQQRIWQRSDFSQLASTVLDSTEHILAMSAYLQNRWYESQLAVVTSPPVGALCQRVDLRSPALASIASVDPLNVGGWSSVCKSTAWLAADIATSSLAGVVGMCLWNRLSFIPMGKITHHALFDLEHE